MLAQLLETVSRFFYSIGQRRWVTVLCILTGIASVVMIALGRSDVTHVEEVRDVGLDAIDARIVNKYVRVSGTLVPARAFQTQIQLGPIGLRNGRYFPLTQPGVASPLFVLDENVPGAALTGSPTTLVGRLLRGAGNQQPPLYLEIGVPPTLLSLTVLAKVGIVLVCGLLLLWVLSVWLRRTDYAVEMPLVLATRPSSGIRPSANLVLWFGEVGREFEGVQLRHAPVRISARAREARFEVRDGDTLVAWAQVRRIIRSHAAAVATQFGFLPAERIEFEDERGLSRLATLVFGSAQSRRAVLEILQHVGHLG